MERRCINCGAVLARDNLGKLCSPCQKKRFYQRITYDDEIIDAEDFAFFLGLTNAESVKRLARKGKLPPRIPRIRKYLWYKRDYEAWKKQQQEEDTQEMKRVSSRESRRLALMLASSLRRLSNDVYIIGLFEIPGEIVFGTENYLGTTEDHRIDIIQLPTISKTAANKLLELLPDKDFPELKGITDWGKLPYERIHEAFLVRLESYF